MKNDGIVRSFDDFTAEQFVSAVETAVNNFGFSTEETAKKLASMSDDKQVMLRQAIDSCIYTLAHTDRIDGRNEISAETCRKLHPVEDPMPDVGSRFLRVHPTLQQSSMKLFCCYLDKPGAPDHQEEMEALREEIGPEWYRFPLI